MIMCKIIAKRKSKKAIILIRHLGYMRTDLDDPLYSIEDTEMRAIITEVRGCHSGSGNVV